MPSFNGAAFSRTRKHCTECATELEEDQLQWGRVLTNAETRKSKQYLRRRAELQWGRVLTNAETRAP